MNGQRSPSKENAFSMFIKNVVRTRTLPFIVTDVTAEGQENKIIMAQMKSALQSMREQSVANGNSEMTLDEINEEIAAYRKEKRGQ
jgi:antitoxin component of RelBE/YafQ-DinJ toxin-antitoxin module